MTVWYDQKFIESVILTISLMKFLSALLTLKLFTPINQSSTVAGLSDTLFSKEDYDV